MPRSKGEVSRGLEMEMPLGHWLGMSCTLQLFVTQHGEGCGHQRARHPHGGKANQQDVWLLSLAVPS